MSAVLRVSALTKRYGPRRARDARAALENVSFHVEAGELVAVVGPNGAGKTTLLSIIAAVQTATDGSVLTAAAAPAGGGVGVGWVPQTPALYAKLSVLENLQLFARLERLESPQAAVARMLEQTGLRERAREPVARLSGGNRQRVNVAVGLIADPPVLVLDEPSAALDPSQRERLWELVCGRVAAGTAVLFSTHNVSEAQRYASRVLVLDGGRLLFDGAPQELLTRGGESPGGDLERALVRFLEDASAAATSGGAYTEGAP